MRNLPAFSVRLDALLRAEGMRYGPDVWQSVAILLNRLEDTGQLPSDENQLAPLLGPIFCRHPEDQARFPLLFVQALADDDTTSSPIVDVCRIVAPDKAITNSLRSKAEMMGKHWFAATVLLIGILLAGYHFWSISEPSPLPPPVPLPYPEPISGSWLAKIIQISIVWLPSFVALAWLVKKYSKLLILRNQAYCGDDLLDHFRFERVLTPIFGGTQSEQVLRDLRAATFQTTCRLDVSATVEATARNGDYFQPRFKKRRLAPEHLILVRSQHHKDQQAAIAEELVVRFRNLGITVHAYQFRDDPRWLTGWRKDQQKPQYFQLSQLLYRHRSARLLIISETEILFHPYSGEPRPWLQEFTPWQQKIWLHPRTASSHDESLLARNQFLLLPLARNSSPKLVKHLTEPDVSKVGTQAFFPLWFPELLTAEPDVWLRDNPPFGTDLAELESQLESYLGSYGMRLLRALAVYPKPHWQLTQALDHLLSSKLNKADTSERREYRFVKLSRLPWLIHGHLPNWLRENLLRGMTKEERSLVSNVWQSLFSQLSDKDNPTNLKLDYKIPSKRQVKVRLADFQTMNKSTGINDAIFINILLGGKLGLLDFRLPQAFRRHIPSIHILLKIFPALTVIVVAGLCTLGLHWFLQLIGTDLVVWKRLLQLANDNYDQYVMKPAAESYDWIMPDFAQKGVSNFFSNLGDITVTINDLFQFKLFQFGKDALRFLVNSTVGIGGVVDIASEIHLPKHYEDFDQTLGVWGLPSGPYIVLPFIGPSTPRGLLGLIGDVTTILLPLLFLFLVWLRISPRKTAFILVVMFVLFTVNNRANRLSATRILGAASINKHEFIRNDYFDDGNYNIYGGNPRIFLPRQVNFNIMIP